MSDFTTGEINAVWEKAIPIPDKKEYKTDKYGTWIKRSDYGDRHSDFGWEIDHIEPKSKGGSDDISNLQPLHWRNNVEKSDK